MNASIWTLKFEVTCYLVLAAVSWFGLSTKHRFSWVLGVTGALAGGFLFARFGHDAVPIDQAARFWLCFSLGIGFYIYRDVIPLTIVGVIALGLGFWLSLGSGLERVVTLVATGYAVVWSAKIPTGRLRHLTNKIDLSYGIYIFGWPITQTLILLYPGLDVISLVILSLVLAAIIALPSWLWIERPALRSRRAAMALLELGPEAAWWWRLPSAKTAIDRGKQVERPDSA